MLSRSAKATFYLLAGPLMTANGWIHRAFRSPRTGPVRVHLGPGQRNYLPGWINVDANMFTARCDAWLDLRNRLPFGNDSVDACYSHHVVEHLPDLRFHFRDVFRFLKPGGVYRVGGPNGDAAIQKFVEGDKDWFGDFPEKRRSIGGRLENFIFCSQEHLTILTFSFLEEMLTDAGFTEIRRHVPVEATGYPELFAPCLKIESERTSSCPHTLIVEAKKPGAVNDGGAVRPT